MVSKHLRLLAEFDIIIDLYFSPTFKIQIYTFCKCFRFVFSIFYQCQKLGIMSNFNGPSLDSDVSNNFAPASGIVTQRLTVTSPFNLLFNVRLCAYDVVFERFNSQNESDITLYIWHLFPILGICSLH